MERRRHARHPRYFPVRFGTDETAWDGRTNDVSSGGLFVTTRDALPAGTRLWLELFIEPDRPLHLEGVVVRQLAALPARRRDAGFAVRLLSPAEALAPWMPPPSEERVVELPKMTFETRAAADRAAAQGLGNGHWFVWAKGAHAIGQRVRMSFAFPFARASVDARGAVTQVVDDGGRTGLALTLDDVDEVRATLARVLEGGS